VVVSGWFLFCLGRRTRRLLQGRERSIARVYTALTAVASVGFLLLVLVAAHLIDRNLGGYRQRELFDVNVGCVVRLAFSVDVLAAFLAAGQGALWLAQLCWEQFRKGLAIPGLILAALACAATFTISVLGWVLAICLSFTLFYRQ
jgi:hypothetical protein